MVIQKFLAFLELKKFLGLQFRVAEISNFSKAFSSVQFSSFLFSQNTVQCKNTYRNCKVAREPRGNQKAL